LDRARGQGGRFYRVWENSNWWGRHDTIGGRKGGEKKGERSISDAGRETERGFRLWMSNKGLTKRGKKTSPWKEKGKGEGGRIRDKKKKRKEGFLLEKMK